MRTTSASWCCSGVCLGRGGEVLVRRELCAISRRKGRR
jgi:hypothetical protein